MARNISSSKTILAAVSLVFKGDGPKTQASGAREVFLLIKTSFNRSAFAFDSETIFPQRSINGGRQVEALLFNPHRSLATCHRLDGEHFATERECSIAFESHVSSFHSVVCCGCFVSS